MFSKITIAVMCLVALASLVQVQGLEAPVLTQPVTEAKTRAACTKCFKDCTQYLNGMSDPRGPKCGAALQKCEPLFTAMLNLVLGLLLNAPAAVLALINLCLPLIVQLTLTLGNCIINNCGSDACKSKCTTLTNTCMTNCRNVPNVTAAIILSLGIFCVGLLKICILVVL